jgi:DNA/RNA-binding domain of Phe-tRNA-synthetase-like protein
MRPSQFRASIESLLRRALGGSGLDLPIPSVNLYNALSLKHLAPMGAYDLAKLPAAPMKLRLAVPGVDRFDPLGGKADDFPLSPDLVVYASSETVLCWGFNCRDSRETALDAASDRIAFFSESLDAAGAARSQAALAALRSVLVAAGTSCGPLLAANATDPCF